MPKRLDARKNAMWQPETGQQLTKRFRIVQQAKEGFWDRWVKEVFPSLLKQ
jgi:hypothetical protein